MLKQKVAIVGAGVIGVTTALMIQDRLANATIYVIADKFFADTVSSVAAGIFRPGTSFRGPTSEITKKWIDDSWNWWIDLLKTEEGSIAGITELSAYILSKNNPQLIRNHLIEDLVTLYRETDSRELEDLCGGGWKHGAFFTTLLIDSNKYLPWASKKFERNGGHIVTRKIGSFKELENEYDLIFNCTGFGAKELCNDHDLVPMRGQVIKVKAPWIKTAFYCDYDTYIIPGSDGTVTLGGTRQYDSYNMEVCKHDYAAIMERCVKMLPALADAEVLQSRVGLRPHRVPVRVEAEKLDSGAILVHCYGHGGYGVTCAPGTVKHAITLGLDLIDAKH